MGTVIETRIRKGRPGFDSRKEKWWDSHRQRVQTDSWVQPACYSMGARGYFSGSKAAGTWSWPLTFLYCYV